MGYLKIPNLYREQAILLFREAYSLEKVHGTSANLKWHDEALSFFSGGANHQHFVSLFDATTLAEKFAGLGHDSVEVYGEAYGGKMQGMSATYGPDLRFIVFDVKVGPYWLTVPNAEEVALKLGLEFVPYKRIQCVMTEIDRERDNFSHVAFRRGLGTDKKREGVVLRPIEEAWIRGERVIVKHKRDEFRETATPRTPKEPLALEEKSAAEDVALEYVTEMRLRHVLDKVIGAEEPDMKHTRDVINGMIDDIRIEGAEEVTMTDPVRKAIGVRTVALFKTYLSERLCDA